MTPVIILSVICTLLVLLLIIAAIIVCSFNREMKSYHFLQDSLKTYLKENTDAIRELGDDVRQGNTTINIESLIKEYSPISPSIKDKEALEKMVIDALLQALNAVKY